MILTILRKIKILLFQNLFLEISEESVTEIQIVKEVTLATSGENIVEEQTIVKSEEVREDEESVRQESVDDLTKIR